MSYWNGHFIWIIKLPFSGKYYLEKNSLFSLKENSQLWKRWPRKSDKKPNILSQRERKLESVHQTWSAATCRTRWNVPRTGPSRVAVIGQNHRLQTSWGGSTKIKQPKMSTINLPIFSHFFFSKTCCQIIGKLASRRKFHFIQTVIRVPFSHFARRAPKVFSPNRSNNFLKILIKLISRNLITLFLEI